MGRFSLKSAEGIVAMVLAMLLLPVVDAISKHLASSYDASQITWARNAFHAMIVLPIAFFRHGGAGLFKGLGALQLLRAAAFVSMTAFYIAGLPHMPLAEALAIVFLYPLVITVVAALFLRERVGVYRWGAIFAGLVGVCLVVKPGFETLSPGVPLVFVAMIMTVVYLLLTRKLAGTSPDLVMLAWPAALGALLLSPVAIDAWKAPTLPDLGLMLAIGAGAAIVHLLMIVAYTRAPASTVAPLAYLQIVIGAALGYAVFRQLPDAASWTGIVLIVSAGILTMLREGRGRRNQGTGTE